MVIPEQDYGHLPDAVMSVMLASNLQPIQSMVSKVIQLYETCIVRHGVMLVGPSGGGKTTVLRVCSLCFISIPFTSAHIAVKHILYVIRFIKFTIYSTCIFFLKCLGDALGELHKQGIKDPQFFPVHYYIINPKSVTMGELYGEVNPLTMEWRDGVLGISVRTAVQVSFNYLILLLNLIYENNLISSNFPLPSTRVQTNTISGLYVMVLLMHCG